MLIAMYYLQDSITRLKNISKTIKADKEKEASKLDYTVTRGNTIQAYMDYKAAIRELIDILSSPDQQLLMANTMMPMIERSILEADNLDRIDEAVGMLVTPFEQYENYQRYSNYDTKYEKRAHFNEEGFSTDYMRQVFSKIKGMTRPLKVLNTYARDGENMLEIKDIYSSPVELYAVDVNGDIWSANKPKFYRIAMGELKGATISNDVFDVVMVAPPLTLLKSGKSFIEKIERDYLQKSLNYLRDGGLMLYALPITHLYKEICQFLAKNLTEVQIRVENNRIYVSGYRNMDKERRVAREANLKLRTIILHQNDDEYKVTNTMLDIHIPSMALPVKMFRGSRLDEDEFCTMFEQSSATVSFWKEQVTEKLSESSKTPLLPFNIGQLGLILTSGCLDGVVDESNGYGHVVKGRVVKKCDVTQDVSVGESRLNKTEITSNRVEINVFLPDGTYKCLA